MPREQFMERSQYLSSLHNALLDSNSSSSSSSSTDHTPMNRLWGLWRL
jgi:hypothetical protein